MTIQPHQNLRDGASSLEDSHRVRRSTVVILGLALLARLLVLILTITHNPHNWFYSRPIEMGLVANSLLHGLGYSSPFGGATGPTAIIAPGYPTVVAAVFLVFGSFTHASAVVLILLNILFSLLTIWLMMHLARTLFDERTALFAGTFWALSLPLFWIPTIFWESSLSACALPAILALALRCRRQPTRAIWALLGATSALIALINPALLPSLLAILGWLGWQTRRQSRTAPLIGLLVLLALYSPWPIRNAIRFHAFIPMRSTVGLEMYMGNHPGATGYVDANALPAFNKQEMASYISLGEIAYTHNRSVQAWQYVRSYPAVFLRLSVRRFFRFWSGTGNLESSRVFEVHALLTTVFGFTGLFILLRNRRRALAVLLALPLLLFPLPYYITHAEIRYRLNIDPLMTILAAYAVTQLAAAWCRKRVDEKTPSSCPQV